MEELAKTDEIDLEERLKTYQAAFADVHKENRELRMRCNDYQHRLENLTKAANTAMNILDYALSMYGRGDIG